MVYVTHKFRAAIGKSKLIRDGETVLVGVSGGQASSCLLHLIQEVCEKQQKCDKTFGRSCQKSKEKISSM